MTAVLLLRLIVVAEYGFQAAGSPGGQHGFDFYCRSDTWQQVAPGGSAVFWFALTNTGSQRDVFRFDCCVLESIPGTTVIYCVGGLCTEPGVPLFDSLDAGETDTAIDVSLFNSGAEGIELIRLSVRSLGDTTLADSILVGARVSSSVGEGGSVGSPARLLMVLPNPGSGSCRRIRLAVPTCGWYRIDLLSSAGSWMTSLYEGYLEEGIQEISGCFDRGLPAGMYLLRLVSPRVACSYPLVLRW